MSTARVTLDSPVFSGRIRQFSRGTPFIHAPVKREKPIVISDVNIRQSSLSSRSTVAQPKAAPFVPRQSHSEVLLRNATPAPMATPFKVKRTKAGLSQKIMFAMASLVFVAGISVALLGLKTNKEVVGQVRGGQTNSAAAVSEEKPTEQQLSNYSVDPSLPRYVRISKLNVFARVQRQGVDTKGALKAPYNVHDAGWYENSSKPGEAGAVLLDGHVAGPTAHGVFYDIKKLVKGDKIELERGDGKKFTYQVVSSKTTAVDKTDMNDGLVPIKAGESGLNLITCTGKYDYKTGEYDQRIMVFATLVK